MVNELSKKIHRFIGDFVLRAGPMEIKDKDAVHQISRVLHLAPGEEIILCDGKGGEARVRLREVEAGLVTGDILEVEQNKNEPSRRAILYCAILKRDSFEWLTQKATEVGVAEIIPIITERTVKLNLNLERLRKIVKEAAEQSGRGVVPQIKEPLSFQAALERAFAHDLNVFFDITAKEAIADVLDKKIKSIGVFIGPEGGWGQGEVQAARKQKFQFAGLGPLILRAETAAIIAAYLLTRNF